MMTWNTEKTPQSYPKNIDIKASIGRYFLCLPFFCEKIIKTVNFFFTCF